MIARVRGVSTASTAAGSRLKVSRSMSAKTGTALAFDHRRRGRHEGVGRDDDLVFGADAGSEERDAQSDRAVRDAQSRARQPCIAAKRLSNSATSVPWSRPQWPLRSVRSRRSSSGLPKIGQCGNGPRTDGSSTEEGEGAHRGDPNSISRTLELPPHIDAPVFRRIRCASTLRIRDAGRSLERGC